VHMPSATLPQLSDTPQTYDCMTDPHLARVTTIDQGATIEQQPKISDSTQDLGYCSLVVSLQGRVWDGTAAGM
jgi:hypothetical protein